jgi:dipeptidyl aminopeptidase/acylaminoacyl peptidase
MSFAHSIARWFLALSVPAVAGCMAHTRAPVFADVLVHEPSSNGTPLAWIAIEPRAQSYPVALYLTGSGCHSVIHSEPYLQALADAGYGVVAPEKRGIAIDADGYTQCTPEYLATNDRQQRIADTELVLSRVRARLSGLDGRLVVIGASEGGQIAPEIATRHPETAALIIIGAGGRDQATDMKDLAAKRGDDPKALDATFAAIEADPVSTKTWAGKDNTYKRWASYLRYRPMDYLVKLRVPIFVAQGANDAMSPVESAMAIDEEFARLDTNRDLKVRIFVGLGHTFADAQGRDHFREVGAELLDWLRDKVPPTK